MSEKKELISKMIEMQKQFRAYEQENGFSMAEYYDAPEGHLLHNYRHEFKEMSTKLREMAHAEKGSVR